MLINLQCQFRQLEVNLEGLKARVPELPLDGILLTRIVMHMGRSLAAMFEHQIRPFGLAEPEFRVLMTLFSQPEGAHPGDLCGRTSHSPANISRISDALFARGLISRVPSLQDRRKTVLLITAQGEELVRLLMPQIQGPLYDIVSDLSVAEQRQMIEQLRRVAARLDVAATELPVFE